MMSNTEKHENHREFVEYYSRESATVRARDRALGIMSAVLRARDRLALSTKNLRVADIGCNAGTQSRVWLEGGHSVCGLDISQELVGIARERNVDFSGLSKFEVGSATEVPWPSGSFDVCLLPELLEHVAEWEACLNEAIRVLASDGTIFVSTTNSLCPRQQEFNLPLYSWYPRAVKKYYEKLATSEAPQIANYATHPAVNWFTPYGLGRFLKRSSMLVEDRFDLLDPNGRGVLIRAAVTAVRLFPPLRFVGYVLSEGTILIGHKLSPHPSGKSSN